jgi:anti-sigma factor RsiW
MDCRQVQPKIADYSVGLLRAGEAEQMRAHLSTCAECGREWREMEAVMGLVERLGSREPPPHLWNGIYNRITQEERQERPAWWEWLLRGPRRLVAGTATGLAAAALAATIYFNIVPPPRIQWAKPTVAGNTAMAVQQHAMLAGAEPFADEVGLEAYAQLVNRANGSAQTVTQ